MILAAFQEGEQPRTLAASDSPYGPLYASMASTIGRYSSCCPGALSRLTKRSPGWGSWNTVALCRLRDSSTTARGSRRSRPSLAVHREGLVPEVAGGYLLAPDVMMSRSAACDSIEPEPSMALWSE